MKRVNPGNSKEIEKKKREKERRIDSCGSILKSILRYSLSL